MDSRATEYLIVERGLTDDTIDRFQLSYDPVRNGVRIPYFDGKNREIGARVRLFAGTSKYLPIDHFGAHLFNVVDAVKSPVYLTEGEFDAMILVQLGYNAVGVPGSNAFQENWRWLFHESEVKIMFDGDAAGQTASRKVRRMLQAGADVEQIALPDGEDVNSLYLKGELKQWLSG